MGSAEGISAQPAKTKAEPVAPVWHTVVFIVVLLGLAILQSRASTLARASQVPTRIPTYVLTICYEYLMLGYVWLLGLRRYGKSIREVIGGKWSRWMDFWRDVLVAFCFWLVILAVLATLSYLVHFNSNAAVEFMLPQTIPEMIVWVVLATSAGFCEEFIFRGYLQRQFLAFTQSTFAAIVLQGIVFGMGHLYQGRKALIVISVYGMLFGALAALRKSLLPGMLQHATQDSVAGIAGHFVDKLRHLHMLKF